METQNEKKHAHCKNLGHQTRCSRCSLVTCHCSLLPVHCSPATTLQLFNPLTLQLSKISAFRLPRGPNQTNSNQIKPQPRPPGGNLHLELRRFHGKPVDNRLASVLSLVTTARMSGHDMTDRQHTQISLAVGQHLSLAIHDLAFGGEGVARHEGFVIFVPFVAVGETVEAELTEVKKQFARARLLRVLQPSPERVEPQCRYFGLCGGCQYQHLAYPAQLEFKRKQVADLFQRLGGFDPAVVAPVVSCPQPYGYRNRLMVRSQWNKPRQALDIGFIRHDCGLVVDVETCAIAEPVLNEQLQHVRAHPPPKGGIKMVLRAMPDDWVVPQDSFFQTNFHLLPRLVETVRDALRGSGVRFLLDVYCGVGFFGISLADQVKKFLGVEYDQMAIRAAKQNMARQGRTNGDFVTGNAEELLPGLLQCYPAPETAVVLDPPRTGCPRSALELLREVRPAQIIYISCHPATLARDLNVLCADGVFELKKMTPLDMFPQTQHVECVADLRLGQGQTCKLSLPTGLGSSQINELSDNGH